MERIITIRHSEAKDAENIKQIYQGIHAYTDTLQLPYPSSAVWESRVSNIPDNVYSFVAEIDGKVVGNLGFEINKNPRRRHCGSFGMGVHDNYLEQGVGSSLLSALIDITDNWLNIKRIEITVYIDNKAAIALYEKFGFTIEGESPDFAFRNGEFVSVYHMARIKK